MKGTELLLKLIKAIIIIFLPNTKGCKLVQKNSPSQNIFVLKLTPR